MGKSNAFPVLLIIPILILGVPIGTPPSRSSVACSDVSPGPRATVSTSTTASCASATARVASVVILWLWTALLSAAALIPTYTNRGNALVPIALGALALLLYSYFHPGVVACAGSVKRGVPRRQVTTRPKGPGGSRARRPDRRGRRPRGRRRGAGGA